MANEDVCPPKKRWQQRSRSPSVSSPSPSSFRLNANHWRHQSVLILDKDNAPIYHQGFILDIIDSHLVEISRRDQQLPAVIIDLQRPISKDFPSIIIDNIPACEDLRIDRLVCVRRMATGEINQFLCGRIRKKHPIRLEFSIDFKDSNNNNRDPSLGDETDKDNETWFTRQNIRLLVEPWHEEFCIFQDSLSTGSESRAASTEPSKESAEHVRERPIEPVSPLARKDDDGDDDDDDEEKLHNRFQGVKKGDVFTARYLTAPFDCFDR